VVANFSCISLLVISPPTAEVTLSLMALDDFDGKIELPHMKSSVKMTSVIMILFLVQPF
jgi:hypothetical protein